MCPCVRACARACVYVCVCACVCVGLLRFIYTVSFDPLPTKKNSSNNNNKTTTNNNNSTTTKQQTNKQKARPTALWNSLSEAVASLIPACLLWKYCGFRCTWLNACLPTEKQQHDLHPHTHLSLTQKRTNEHKNKLTCMGCFWPQRWLQIDASTQSTVFGEHALLLLVVVVVLSSSLL